MDMVEKVREAISRILLRGEAADQDSFDWVTEVARAAIEAMREPTEAMAEYNGYSLRERHAGLWRSMVDKALSDQPRPTEEKA